MRQQYKGLKKTCASTPYTLNIVNTRKSRNCEFSCLNLNMKCMYSIRLGVSPAQNSDMAETFFNITG